jgi:hypothetical protein
MATLRAKVRECIDQLDVGLDTRQAFDARMSELNVLSKELRPKAKRLSLLRLPRYMRRRAASHNPRRLPKRFRYVGGRLNPNVTAHVTKKRKRLKKHLGVARRRKSADHRNHQSARHLLHIWFRKRFQMKSVFGLHSAWQNNTKNFRLLCRQTQQQTIFFHLPHFVYARLTCWKTQASTLQDVMSRLFSSNASTFKRIARQEACVTLHDDRNPNVLLGVVRLVQINCESSSDTIELLVSTSTLTSDIVFDRLKSVCIDNDIQFTPFTKQFQRFRMIGKKANLVLSNIMGKVIDKENEQRDEGAKSRFEGVKFLNGRNRLFIWNANYLFDGPSETLRAVAIDLAFDSRRIVQSIDVIVPSNCAKRFWYALVHNRSHLVGGLRNSMYFALERKMSSFPFLGSCDCIAFEANRQRQTLLKEILRSTVEPEDSLNESSAIAVLRHIPTLESLGNALGNLNNVVAPSTNSEERLVMCHLEMIKRGVLTENDLLYLPTQQDLILAFGNLASVKRKHCDSDYEFEPTETSKLSLLDDHTRTGLMKRNRVAIGCVEYGEFCLRSGKGEASAIVLLSKLVQLIQVNAQALQHSPEQQEARTSKPKLLVLTRQSNSNRYRFAELSVRLHLWFA